MIRNDSWGHSGDAGCVWVSAVFASSLRKVVYVTDENGVRAETLGLLQDSPSTVLSYHGLFTKEFIDQPRGWPAAESALHDAAVEVVLLDLFDTVLLRRVRAETHRFRDLAHRLHDALRRVGAPAPPAAVIWQARCRAARLAYRTARLTDGCREGTLPAILRIQLADLHLDESLGALFRAEELAWETSQLRLSPAAMAFIARARSLGKQVIACSDMYLSAEDVGTILSRLGAAAAFDAMHISSETRVGKSNGAMFRHVIGTSGIVADSLLHVGDNYVADVVGARRAGVRAVWVPRGSLFRLGRFADELLASRVTLPAARIA